MGVTSAGVREFEIRGVGVPPHPAWAENAGVLTSVKHLF